MDSSDSNVDRWADDRLASLDPPSDWRPNAGQALERLRARGRARPIGRGLWLWAASAAAVAAAAGVGLLTLRTPQLTRPLQTPVAQTAETPAIPLAAPSPPPARIPEASAPKPVAASRPAEPPVRNFKESGSPAAPITVEIYLDYECPPCAAFYREMVPPLIARYVGTGTVRLLRRDLPLPHHQYAAVAARYANAAGRAGYYDAAVARIFQTLAVWSLDGDIDAQLAQVLPAEAMHQVRDLVSNHPAWDDGVAEDAAMARRDQISRTPAFVIVSKRERKVLGPIASFAALQTQIDQSLAPPNTGNPATLEDFKASDAARETWDIRAADILKALEAAPGDWVADVGAGAGYYTMRLSALVSPSGGSGGGPGGKVFAEDISDTSLAWLDRRVRLFHLPNVELVQGAADDPKLPAASLAAVLVVNSYHHFTQHQAMAAQIRRALKPGGRLVIADYSLQAHRAESRAEQLKRHEIDPDLVRAELTQAGFQVLKTEDPFLQRMPDARNAGGIANADMWLMTAVRP